MYRLSSRRDFLVQGLAATSIAASIHPSTALGQVGGQTQRTAKNDRPSFGLIGAGWQPETRREGRGLALGRQAAQHGDVAVICELDTVAGDYAKQKITSGRASLVDDYHKVIDDSSIDAVLIATPDHWHAKIAIEAMRAGKDVYCEKPVGVTIDEGKRIRKVVNETGRVFQVGTQQRSEYDQRFLKAIAIVQDGRIGDVKRIRIGLTPGWKGGPFQSQAPPPTLDWDRWLGPAPKTDYIPQRVHRTFRWWYEYAGGQICDWGAHHVDIAQMAIGMHNSGPTEISGSGTLNQPLVDGMPTRDDQYNTPIEFDVRCRFAGGIEMIIDSSRNGITFEGTKGRFFVNRGTLEGVPVASLAGQPLPDDWLHRIDGRQKSVSHMQNFVDCMGDRKQPVSDIASHHRTLTTCHLANIAVRLGRPIQWNPDTETIVIDTQATKLTARTYRDGYEPDVT